MLPSISEYKYAIQQADAFATLKNLQVVLHNGEPYMVSGGYSVVFKMHDKLTQKFYALKCFHKPKENLIQNYTLISQHLANIQSHYLVKYQLYPNELWVSTNATAQTEFDVLLMDWVEGQKLGNALCQYAQQNNTQKLQYIAQSFVQLSQWLLSQAFAHCDLKTDNIIISPTQQLYLVDYDDMFVPAMQGQQARVLGTPGYMHPLATPLHFNAQADNFSILLINLSLQAIAIQPSLLPPDASAEILLFTQPDLENIHQSTTYHALFAMAKTNNAHTTLLLSLLQMELASISSSNALLQMALQQISRPLLEINPSTRAPRSPITTKVGLWSYEYEDPIITKPSKAELTTWYNTLDDDWKKKLNFNINTIEEDINNLKELKLFYSFFTDFNPLKYLTQLTSLNLRACKNLTDFGPLKYLTQLTSLNLSYCPNITDLSALQNLTKLTTLDLSVCANITDFSPLKHLKQLTSLNLEFNKNITDLSALQHLKQLTTLNLKGCENITDINPLQYLTQLTSLDLRFCINLTDISPLQYIIQLTALDLSYCKNIKDLSPLQHLTQLPTLDLSNCKNITDLRPLQNLIQLTKLELYGCVKIKDLSILNNIPGLKIKR